MYGSALKVLVVVGIASMLSACLVSNPPDIPRSQLLQLAELQGRFFVEDFSKDKDKEPRKPARIQMRRDGTYHVQIQNPNKNKDGTEGKPSDYDFRLIRFPGANGYLLLVDKGWEEKTLYGLLSQENDGSWTVRILTIKVAENAKTNERAVAAARRAGVEIEVKSHHSMDHTIKGRVDAATLTRLFSNQAFVNEVGASPLYRFYPARPQVQTARRCGSSVPSRYAGNEYGGTLYALEGSCERTFSQKEQLFIAGLSQGLLEECGLPSDTDSRLKLQKFLSSSLFVGIIGGQYGNKNLGKGLGDQMESMAAYTAGGVASKQLGCGQVAGLISQGIVNYLDRTATGNGSGARYVEGCARYYSGRYTRQQCQCIADIGRAIIPDIHQSRFTSGSIKQIVQSNPFVGFQIAIQCGIGDY